MQLFQAALSSPLYGAALKWGVMEQKWQDPARGTSGRYMPMEIKVLTYFGEKHYDKSKAFYSQWSGWSQIPDGRGFHSFCRTLCTFRRQNS